MRKLAGLVSAAGLVFTVACGQTDAGITSEVKSKLAADETVNAYQIDVDTNNHVVTLSGDVAADAKDRAVTIARNTDGVRDVIDQLRVDDTAATSGTLDVDAPDVDVDADVDVDDDAEATAREGARTTESGARRGAGAVAEGARKGTDAVVDGAKKGANAVVDGAKKVGSEVTDAVTDDDRDSDNDGK